MKNKVLRVGIAGFGIVGRRRYDVIRHRKDLELVGICDQVTENLNYVGDEVKKFDSYPELLNENLDIAFICLTNDVNPNATNMALRKGLHVFCEKPPGRSLADIAAIQRVATECQSQVLMYGFNHRYHDSVQHAVRIIKSGSLGKIINLKGVYGKSRLITFNQPDWRTKRSKAGGGVLLDQGIHMLDLMRLFAGEFTQVHSIVSNSHWQFDVEDNAYALMRTEEGVVGTLVSSATQWRHRFHLDISLELGSVILSGLLTGTKSYGSETLTVSTVDPKVNNGDPEEVLYRYNRDPSWEMEIDEFIQSIRLNKQPENGTLIDALNTMKLVNDIYFADKKWRDAMGIKSSKEQLQ